MTEWQANVAMQRKPTSAASAAAHLTGYAIRRECDGRIVGTGYGTFAIAYEVATARRLHDGERYHVETMH